MPVVTELDHEEVAVRWHQNYKVFRDQPFMERDPNESRSFKSVSRLNLNEEPTENSVYEKVNDYFRVKDESVRYDNQSRSYSQYGDDNMEDLDASQYPAASRLGAT